MSNCYDGQTAQFIAVTAQNMPKMMGDVMQWWIDNPLELQGALAGLGKIPCPELKDWKTIRLGTGLKDNGNCIGDWANDLLGKPEFENSVSKEEVEVDLVVLTTAQLTGKANGGTTAEVFAGAERLGLKKCSAEVGPQLREQYAAQPNGEWLLIGMEPIRRSGGDLGVFSVGHDGGGRWLGGDYVNPDGVWNAGYRWVFVRPRK